MMQGIVNQINMDAINSSLLSAVTNFELCIILIQVLTNKKKNTETG